MTWDNSCALSLVKLLDVSRISSSSLMFSNWKIEPCYGYYVLESLCYNSFLLEKHLNYSQLNPFSLLNELFSTADLSRPFCAPSTFDTRFRLAFGALWIHLVSVFRRAILNTNTIKTPSRRGTQACRVQQSRGNMVQHQFRHFMHLVRPEKERERGRLQRARCPPSNAIHCPRARGTLKQEQGQRLMGGGGERRRRIT